MNRIANMLPGVPATKMTADEHRKEFEFIKETAVELFGHYGCCEPVIFGFSKAKGATILPGHTNSIEERDFTEQCLLGFVAQGAEAVAMVVECWMLMPKPWEAAGEIERALEGGISEHPQRIEAVIVTYATEGSEWMEFATIDRSGAKPTLKAWVSVATAGGKGRFAGLFERGKKKS